MAPERLQKIIAGTGVASRRRAEQLITTGRVAVNGVVVTTLGARADPDIDVVTLDGVPVRRDRYRYLLMNKPRGVVTTARDEQGRRTVFDLLPAEARELHTIGRLDLDSEGLLILTNDGALTALLTHPSHQVEKEYLVEIDAPLGARAAQRLVRGVDVEGERLKARAVQDLGPGDTATGICIAVVLAEGRKREIRRMMTHLGRRVVRLQRVRTGNLRLGSLAAGAWRELTSAEVDGLYAAAGRAGAVGGGQGPALPPPPPGGR